MAKRDVRHRSEVPVSLAEVAMVRCADGSMLAFVIVEVRTEQLRGRIRRFSVWFEGNWRDSAEGRELHRRAVSGKTFMYDWRTHKEQST